MDPNETLKQIVKLLDVGRVSSDILIRVSRRGLSAAEIDELYDMAGLLDDLVEKVGDLDEWLSNGGFLPGRWTS